MAMIPPCPARPVDGHKGTFGTVIVAGGSPTMIGAVALCATAALRGGAGLVKVAVRQEILSSVLSMEACATGIVLTDVQQANLARLDEADPQQQAVLAVGPGMGRSAWSGQWLETLFHTRRRLVLDADGLNLLAQQGFISRLQARQRLENRTQHHPSRVMTPHPGEYRRLAKALGLTLDPTDEAFRPEAALQLAAACAAVVVLKGRHSVVSDGQRVYRNPTGNPALATAGSGDVLTGLISALIAQGMGSFNAAVLGVYLHGLAGDLWADQYGPSGMKADDLVDLIPYAFHHHRRATSHTDPD